MLEPASRDHLSKWKNTLFIIPNIKYSLGRKLSIRFINVTSETKLLTMKIPLKKAQANTYYFQFMSRNLDIPKS